MSDKGGYRHGMFTLRVPPEVAVRIAELARLYNVRPEEVMLRCIRLAVADDFLTDVLDYHRPDAPTPTGEE